MSLNPASRPPVTGGGGLEASGAKAGTSAPAKR